MLCGMETRTGGPSIAQFIALRLHISLSVHATISNAKYLVFMQHYNHAPKTYLYSSLTKIASDRSATEM